MKKITCVLMIISSCFGYSQFSNSPWGQELKEQRKQKSFAKSSNTPLKFEDIVKEFNDYWKDKDPTQKGSGYKPFKRWENYWKDCLNDDGSLMTPAQVNTAIAQKKFLNNKNTNLSNWEPMGPTDFIDRSYSSANIGRVNAIAVDPNNDQIYYAGTPAGGLWKSIDAGVNWNSLTDELPQIGVSAIAIDPTDSNIIYIGTGDDDAFDTYSIGLLKSIDGGLTWNPTGLSFSNTSTVINEVYIDRSGGDNKVFVSSNYGFFKSTDGGFVFKKTLDAELNDVKLKPGDSNVIYAASNSSVYKSINNGESFFRITPSKGLPVSSSRLVLGVSEANPEYVYVLSSYGRNNIYQGLFKSTDSGESFTLTANKKDIFENTQAWYDLALTVSDMNAEEVYTGVLNIWKSTDGGDSFKKINEWYNRSPSYTHADIHFLRFFNGQLFCGSDGGFFKSTDGGVTFTDLTKGMQIGQFYKIAVSKQNSNKMAGGLQDNGSFGLTEYKEWNVYGGGDGMDAAVDPIDENIYYGFMQGGANLWISINAGTSQTFSVGKPKKAKGNWVTPLAINKEREVYAAYDAIYKLDGDAFERVSTDFLKSIDNLEIDPNNSDIMYVSLGNFLYKSVDKGVSFSVLKTFDRNITSIAVHYSDSSTIYVLTSGTYGKVYKSNDGGNDFIDITGNLPKIPKIVIKHQGRHIDNPLFVGTTVGVYRIDDTLTEWETFDNNMPNTSITDLEINLEEGNITAATYGRGVWQSLIPVKTVQNDISLLAIEVPDTEVNCDNILTSIKVKNNGTESITSINIEYKVNGNVNNTTWDGNLASSESVFIDLPIMNLDFGINKVDVITTIANDTFADNNYSSKTIIKNKTGIGNVLNEFETSSDELVVFNPGFYSVLWERGEPTGELLNSAFSGKSVYATNLSGNYPDNTLGYLVSECYNLSVMIDPVLKFRMAFDLEENWDFMNIEYSTDNGINWQILGDATDPNWYNSDRSPIFYDDCYNCPGAQWTGTDTTLKEYTYNLATLSNENNFIFRFNFVSDGGTVKEGVVIDDLIIEEGGILSGGDTIGDLLGFSLYPNPSKGGVNIYWKDAAKVSYEISDISGKIIETNNNLDSSKGVAELSLASYTTGMYFIRIAIDNNIVFRKLIRN